MVGKSKFWAFGIALLVLGCAKVDKAPSQDADAQAAEVFDADAASLSEDASSDVALSKDCSPSQEN